MGGRRHIMKCEARYTGCVGNTRCACSEIQCVCVCNEIHSEHAMKHTVCVGGWGGGVCSEIQSVRACSENYIESHPCEVCEQQHSTSNHTFSTTHTSMLGGAGAPPSPEPSSDSSPLEPEDFIPPEPLPAWGWGFSSCSSCISSKRDSNSCGVVWCGVVLYHTVLCCGVVVCCDIVCCAVLW